jgi:2'-5' RNA ligase
MEGIRSFIAIEVPRLLQVRLGELQKELKQAEADVRWAHPGNIHLTLIFLGTVNNEFLEKITESLGPLIAEWKPFALRIRGLGCFPSMRNPRVLWVGIDQGKEEVTSLQGAIEGKAAEAAFAKETRPFQPHLTLGRIQSPRRRDLLAQVVENLKEAEVGTFPAREVLLFKSELRPSGAVYTKLKTFPMNEPKE